MSGWEYQIVRTIELDDRGTRKLVKLGAQGWRIVHVQQDPPHIIVIVERPLKPERPDRA